MLRGVVLCGRGVDRCDWGAPLVDPGFGLACPLDPEDRPEADVIPDPRLRKGREGEGISTRFDLELSDETDPLR